MKHNEGNLDRWIRIVLGVIIALLGWYFKTWWGLVALIPLVTGAIGFCALYPIFKINTVKKKE